MNDLHEMEFGDVCKLGAKYGIHWELPLVGDHWPEAADDYIDEVEAAIARQENPDVS